MASVDAIIRYRLGFYIRSERDAFSRSTTRRLARHCNVQQQCIHREASGCDYERGVCVLLSEVSVQSSYCCLLLLLVCSLDTYPFPYKFRKSVTKAMFCVRFTCTPPAQDTHTVLSPSVLMVPFTAAQPLVYQSQHGDAVGRVLLLS